MIAFPARSLRLARGTGSGTPDRGRNKLLRKRPLVVPLHQEHVTKTVDSALLQG